MLTFFRRITHLIRSSRAQRDLTQELEHHRAMRQEHLEAAGMTQGEAEIAARRALGNITLAREDARAIWMPPRLESVWQDVRFTVKTIRRGPAFASVVVLILSIGIGATTCVFGLLDGLALRTLPVREPDQLVWFKDPSFSYPIFTELHARSDHLFSGLFAWNIDRRNVEWSTGAEGTDVTLATGAFYSTLGVAAARGRTFDEGDDRPGGGPDGRVAVISDAAWARRFNRDPSLIGKRISIDRLPFTIIGVMPPGFFGVAPGLSPELTLPVTAIAEPAALRSPTSAWLHLMGRLAPGVTIDKGNAALSTVWPVVMEATTWDGQPPERRARYLARTTSLQPGRAGYSRVRNQFVESLWLLFALTGLLLAVACASVANLLLARADARRKELALRLAIGASRGRVIRQLLTEAAVWTAVGATGGVLLASVAGRALVTLLSTFEDPIALDMAVRGRPMIFTLALSIATAAATALVPALRATRNPSPGLTARGGLAILRGWTMAKSFVSVQVALTVLLLAGAALFTRSLLLILSQDAGFERNRIAIVTTDPVGSGYREERLAMYYSDLLENVSRLPGVQSAALSWMPPISNELGYWTQSIAVDGADVPVSKSRYVYFNAISPGYLDTVRIRLLRGRNFTDADSASAPKVTLINASLAREYFGESNPVGRRISVGKSASRKDLEIVGVVQDVKYQRLQETTRSIAFLPCAQLGEFMTGTNLVTVARASEGVNGSDTTLAAVRSIDPRVPVRIETVADRIRESLVKERSLAVLAVTLGVAALILACGGLYGLIAYSVSRRTKEIGILLALGANPRSVLTMIVRESMTLAAAGTIVGIGASLALGRFARTLLFQVSPTDAVSIAAAAGLMLLVALGAALLPARRAAGVDPSVALRAE